MGKWIQDKLGQPSGAPPAGYESHVLLPWQAIFHNIDTANPVTYANVQDFFGLDADGTFNVVTELYAMRRDGDGSPYENVAAYNPDDLISRVTGALDEMLLSVQTFDSTTQLPAAVAQAATLAEELMPDDDIDATIAAFEARQLTDHLQAVSRMLTGLWLGGSLLSTKTFGALAILEDGRQRTLAEKTAELRNARENQRAQIAVAMTQMGVQYRDREIAMRQSFIATALDSVRIVATIKQDQMDKDLEFILADRFWDLSLMQEALNANTTMYGGQVVSRAQTKGERLGASLMQGVSMGIQGGMAVGNTGAGFGIGLLSTAIGMFG